AFISLSFVILYGQHIEETIESWLNSMVVCEECLTTARWLLFGFVWIAIVVIVLSLVNVYCTLRDWPRARLVKRSLIHPLPLTDVKRGSITTDSIVFTMRSPQIRVKQTLRAFNCEITLPWVNSTEVFV
ncbi:hypothetical protein Tcan_06009, partial [Toxocara canis]